MDGNNTMITIGYVTSVCIMIFYGVAFLAILLICSGTNCRDCNCDMDCDCCAIMCCICTLGICDLRDKDRSAKRR